jgi:hypothetical protein
MKKLGQQVIYDVSKNNDGATFASLSALLSSENLSTLIPIVVRCGGMSIRFVQSSDNKYVQYRLMADTFSTTKSDWQGIDENPIIGSKSLVESGGVYRELNRLVRNYNNADFGVGDENGNIIIKVKSGNLSTKNFNSAKTLIATKIGGNFDYGVTDENYYAVVKFSNGHVYTKNFNSEDTITQLEDIENQLEDIENQSNNYKYITVKFSDFKNSENTDNEAIEDMLSFSSIFENKTLIIDRNITINKAILLPSNTTVLLDGIIIKQADYSFDNVFRGANVPLTFTGNDEDDFISATDKTPWISYLQQMPSSIEQIENIKIIGKNGAQIIGNDINATITHPTLGANQLLVGDYYGIRTNQFNFCYVKNIEISGLTFTQSRGWTVVFEMCSGIKVHDLDITTAVKNGDGIDLRLGCKNVQCYNITGSTADDLIACTCIPNPNPSFPSGNYMFSYSVTVNVYPQEEIEDLYIENVSVTDIKWRGNPDYNSGGHGMICLSAYGGKVQNISINKFSEISGGLTKEAVLKIYHGYGSGYTAGDLNNIRINELLCIKSDYAVMSNCECLNVWLNKIESVTNLTSLSYPNGFKITNPITI